MPAAFQIASSLASVPEPSPRETKVDFASAIFVKASLAEVMPLMPAGSAGGPTTSNELCISSWRFTP